MNRMYDGWARPDIRLTHHRSDPDHHGCTKYEPAGEYAHGCHRTNIRIPTRPNAGGNRQHPCRSPGVADRDLLY